MVINYLKIAFRNFFKTDRSSIYTWINLFGLTIGITAFLLIGHYVHYQLSYDRHFPGSKNILRLVVERIERGESTMRSAKTYAGIGPVLVEELPEVVSFARVLQEECMFRIDQEDLAYNRQKTFWADGSFCDLFALDMIRQGDLELLNKPNHAVISSRAANRLFGENWENESNPIGKTIILNEGIPFLIQGIFEDLPANSHMEVDFVVSYSTLIAIIGDRMNTVMPPGGNFVYNYIKVQEDAEFFHLKAQINTIIGNHTGDLAEHVSYNFDLQRISSIHLNSHFSDELRANGSSIFVWALSIAAVLILVVAWINFINITVARAMNRSKEVGIRKAIGARKRQLAFQFAIETVFAGFLAVSLTLFISFAGGNLFNQITEIGTPLFSANTWKLWVMFGGSCVLGSLIASIYPALVLSSFHPINALKGKNVLSIHNGYFRQGLITFQFAIAILMMACTGAVYHQVSSMRMQDLGVDMERVLVVHSPRSMIGNQERALVFNRLRDELESQTDIMAVASGGCLPGKTFLYHTEDVHVEGMATSVNYSFDLASVDKRYLTALGFELLSGRDFDDNPDEENKLILNEAAIQILGFNDPDEAVGHYLRLNQGDPQQIIGVIANAHFEGLQRDINPLILRYGHGYEFGFFPIKIRSGDYDGIISSVESHWKNTYPKDPFDYFFLDNLFDQQYKNDKAFGQLFGSFALITIFLASLGLFGLISLATYYKSKEIGIRKVFGASALSIVQLLTIDFLKLVLIGSFIALPVAYWAIDSWLNTFAYRFDPSLWMYLLPVLLLIITSFIAISGQAIRAATKNPVDAIAET